VTTSKSIFPNISVQVSKPAWASRTNLRRAHSFQSLEWWDARERAQTTFTRQSLPCRQMWSMTPNRQCRVSLKCGMANGWFCDKRRGGKQHTLPLYPACHSSIELQSSKKRSQQIVNNKLLTFFTCATWGCNECSAPAAVQEGDDLSTTSFDSNAEGLST
jgi:hypothetical protein